MIVRNPTDLGLLLRQARRDAGLTQAQLAAKAAVSTRWIIGMEKGKGTAELHLVFSVLGALDLAVDVAPRRKPATEPGTQDQLPGIAEVMKKLAGNT